MTCAVIVWDREESRRLGRLITRPCGAATGQALTVGADILFAVCQRHRGRLQRAFPEMRP